MIFWLILGTLKHPKYNFWFHESIFQWQIELFFSPKWVLPPQKKNTSHIFKMDIFSKFFGDVMSHIPLVAILKISFTICQLLIVRTEKQIHTSKELKPMFEPSFLAKVGQHSIMPSFEELIRVVYWGQFLALTPTCCSHLLNPRFLWHNGVKYYLKLQYDFYSYTVRPPL